MSVTLCLFLVAALSSNSILATDATTNEALQKFTSLVTSLVNKTLANTIECFDKSNTKILKNTEEFFETILVAQHEFSENGTNFEEDKHKELENISKVSWSAAAECNVDFLTKFRKSYEEAANSAIQSFDVTKDLEQRYSGCQDKECESRLLQGIESSGEDIRKDLKAIEEKACEAVKKLQVDNKESCLKELRMSYLKKFMDGDLELKTNERLKEEGFKGELAKFQDDIKLYLKLALNALSKKFLVIMSINIRDCAVELSFLVEEKSKVLGKITGDGKNVGTKINKINNLILLGRIEVAKAFVVSSKNLTMLYSEAAHEASEVLKVVEVIEQKYENCKGDPACVSDLQIRLDEEKEKAIEKLTNVVEKHMPILEDVVRSLAVDYLEPSIEKFIKLLNQVVNESE